MRMKWSLLTGIRRRLVKCLLFFLSIAIIKEEQSVKGYASSSPFSDTLIAKWGNTALREWAAADLNCQNNPCSFVAKNILLKMGSKIPSKQTVTHTTAHSEIYSFWSSAVNSQADNQSSIHFCQIFSFDEPMWSVFRCRSLVLQVSALPVLLQCINLSNQSRSAFQLLYGALTASCAAAVRYYMLQFSALELPVTPCAVAAC